MWSKLVVEPHTRSLIICISSGASKAEMTPLARQMGLNVTRTLTRNHMHLNQWCVCMTITASPAFKQIMMAWFSAVGVAVNLASPLHAALLTPDLLRVKVPRAEPRQVRVHMHGNEQVPQRLMRLHPIRDLGARKEQGADQSTLAETKR